MSETPSDPPGETPSEVSEEIPGVPPSETPSDPPVEHTVTGFELESIDDLRKIVVMAKGGDPEAQHTLNEFLKFNSNVERTNLPKRVDVQMVIFADYASKTLYPDRKDNPFGKLVDSIAIAFMAKGGDKSKQFVELMKQTPSLSDLKTLEDSSQRSLVDKITGRGKTE